MARKNAGISVSNHAVNRFKERSQWPKAERLTATQVRRILRKLIREGEPAETREGSEVKIEVVKMSYRTSAADNTLYALVKTKPHQQEVVSILDPDSYAGWLEENVTE